MNNLDSLKLDSQICFPVYVASRLITRMYQPLLDKLNITYPQYLVMMVLWESDGIPISEITSLLILNTNTVTPILQRMASLRLIERQRSKKDERQVIVTLTDKGRDLKNDALLIPEKLSHHLISEQLNMDELIQLKDSLTKLITNLKSQ